MDTIKSEESKMKKITIFSINNDYGGIERYVSTLCEMLYQDFEIDIVITYQSLPISAFAFPDNVKIRYLIHEKPDDVSLKELIKSARLIKASKELIRRMKLKYLEIALNKNEIKNLKTDIVITTRNFHHRLISKFCSDDTIVKIATEHNYHQNNQTYIKEVIDSIKGFDAYVLSTQELLNFFKDKVPNVDCQLIPIALASLPEKKAGLSTKNIISIGRFSPEKAFLDLIDIVKIIVKKDKDIKLYLIGDGFQNKEIQNKINDLDLKQYIETPGFLNPQMIEAYMLESSLYVMTSYTEAFGLVLIEAMSYGIPCIAFDSACGARELINEEIGILVPQRDKEKMANTIIDLLNQKELLQQYSKALPSYIKQFTKTEIKKKWIELINRGANAK